MVFTFTFASCNYYSTEKVLIRSENITNDPSYKILKAIMKDGTVVELRNTDATFAKKYGDKQNVIVFSSTDTTRIDAKKIKISNSWIRYLEIKDIQTLIVEKEELKTGLVILTVVGFLAVILAIIMVANSASSPPPPPPPSSSGGSCPFIYSFDGEKYIFDGEPYGGAITEGLKKTDYSRLENLKEVDGKYKILMRNEMDETQNTDEMKLMVIEHPVNTEVAPDISGKMTVYEKFFPPVSVTDENGKDITVFFNKGDNVQWQTDMPEDTLYENKNLKHELILKFPKPQGAKKVKLLVNTGTAQWGEYMIKEMLQFRGDKVDKWYEDINNKGSELFKLYNFVEREELFILKANVLENDKWISKGLIPAGGPYIDEDRIVELNIENVTGDTLYIKLNPPFGYWKFDYAGVIYESENPSKITELTVSNAIDENGNNVKESLTGIDRSYYSMPEMTNFVKIEFDAPAPAKNMNRSLFLKTTGYYDIHLSKDKPEQTELIKKIYDTPGMILEVSVNEYIKKIKSLGLLDK